ncbi:MAG: glycosyl hydrolase, partial [Verrucomicrobia bacterium]|nr:glycosyl hydrolase [Verrucomicrobiota bacterium]
MKIKSILFAAALLLPTAFAAVAADPLAENFRTPPPETRPWCYWYWISDNISKDGITRDLEAMARVGIGEALIGNVVDPDTPLGDVKIFSPRWWEFTEHAVREGKRVGVNIGLFNSPGWSQSGGPWVATNQAMRYLVSSETRVTGPQKFSAKLPAPNEIFQDVAVLAFPAPQADGEKLSAANAQIAGEPALPDIAKLVDGDSQTVCELPDKSKPLAVTFECAAPFTARSVTLRPAAGSFTAQCRLAVADDQGGFRIVREFTMDRRGLSRPQYSVNVGFMVHGATVVSFPAVTARKFRLTIRLTAVENPPVGSAKSDTVAENPTLSEIELSGAARLESSVEKQLGKMHPTPGPGWNSYLWPAAPEPESPAFAVAPGAVQNLTAQLASDGTLNWDVPAGEWIILRTGMTPTGAHNHPTTDEGRGYEVDKMNRAAIFAHYDAMVGKLAARMPQADRSALRHVVIDSYEVGSQNWTDGFGELFRQTYNYDPAPWLPVLTGRIVGSANQSDRFLWDLRRLVADRIAYDYVGGLRDAAHQHGLRLWLENYGHWGFPAEFLQYGGQSDDLGGEFWVTSDTPTGQHVTELRAASSAAHLYGKRVVSAEAFTSPRSFRDYPARIKSLGDWAFCQGINHFVFHVYIHQPWADRKPGVNAWFGTEFNRHNTWFEQSKAWVDYVRRCQGLLQQGGSVADIAYFIGEDAPKMTGARQPAPPAGYDYDFINAEVLLQRAQAKEGRLAIPDGPAYHVLVLPPGTTMRPEVLRKIRDLVAAGVTLLGPAPGESPSLQNFPAADAEVRKLAAELWGDCDGVKATEHAVGKGRVFCGIELGEVFKRLAVAP